MVLSLRIFTNMWKKILWENIEMIFIAILIVVPIRYFLVQPFIVYGSSMQPNFYTQDYLIIDELSYRFRTPERYEVIVFKAPNHPGQYYIKRIIGLPLESIKVENGNINVFDSSGSSVLLNQDFLPEGVNTSGNLSLTLEENQLFVLGDNRLASSDSRNWGPLEKELIVGRVWLRLWPSQRIMAYGF